MNAGYVARAYTLNFHCATQSLAADCMTLWLFFQHSGPPCLNYLYFAPPKLRHLLHLIINYLPMQYVWTQVTIEAKEKIEVPLNLRPHIHCRFGDTITMPMSVSCCIDLELFSHKVIQYPSQVTDCNTWADLEKGGGGTLHGKNFQFTIIVNSSKFDVNWLDHSPDCLCRPWSHVCCCWLSAL